MNDGMGGARPLWIADQVRNDVTMLRIVFTLVFDSSPIKGKGILSVGLACWLPRPVDSRLRSNAARFCKGFYQGRGG